jgi:DNA repair protein RecO (recombination protein O)
MPARSSATEAIVLKRTNTGEMDRIITLLTPHQGKVACVAKGVRKMTSSQRAYLEPGNYISVLLITTSNLPILTQSRLIENFPHSKESLIGMKRLAGVLEIVDKLFPEGVEEVQLFQAVKDILAQLNNPQVHLPAIQQKLADILQELGYQALEDTPYQSVTEYVAALIDRPVNSYDFLTVRKI